MSFPAVSNPLASQGVAGMPRAPNLLGGAGISSIGGSFARGRTGLTPLAMDTGSVGRLEAGNARTHVQAYVSNQSPKYDGVEPVVLPVIEGELLFTFARKDLPPSYLESDRNPKRSPLTLPIINYILMHDPDFSVKEVQDGRKILERIAFLGVNMMRLREEETKQTTFGADGGAPFQVAPVAKQSTIVVHHEATVRSLWPVAQVRPLSGLYLRLVVAPKEKGPAGNFPTRIRADGNLLEEARPVLDADDCCWQFDPYCVDAPLTALPVPQSSMRSGSMSLANISGTVEVRDEKKEWYGAYLRIGMCMLSTSVRVNQTTHGQDVDVYAHAPLIALSPGSDKSIPATTATAAGTRLPKVDVFIDP